MLLLSTLPAWHSVLLLAPTATMVAAAAVAARSNVTGAWRWARAGSVVVLALAGAVVVARSLSAPGATPLVRSDTVTAAMLVLVSLVGWVVIRYSATYLAGEREQRRYVVRLLATLGAVALVIVTDHLLVLALAWTATSLALHGLLTFYGDRPVAVAVAHKKFVLSRLADLCMLGSVVALGTAFGTLRISAITAEATDATTLPGGAVLGVVLIAVAALLRTAQLPFHGWLIQVMEAPTPVSALLHAGVVNLGGFVLLRFAPLVDLVTPVRALLVTVGVATAALAGLVMTARVSIKVSLAWSTCAQMGFMLVQCGLGLWEMALLHLLAHSVYKAHAFLGAGGAVRQTQKSRLAVAPAAPTAAAVATAAVATLAGTTLVGFAWGHLPFAEPLSATLWVMGGIVALALVPLVVQGRRGAYRTWRAPLAAATVALVYLALHEVAGRLVPYGAAAPWVLLAVVAVVFAALFVAQSVFVVAPDGSVARRLHPWLFGGLFLDEAFTRVVTRIWAPPHVGPAAPPLPQVATTTVIAPLPGANPEPLAEPAVTEPVSSLPIGTHA